MCVCVCVCFQNLNLEVKQQARLYGLSLYVSLCSPISDSSLIAK